MSKIGYYLGDLIVCHNNVVLLTLCRIHAAAEDTIINFMYNVTANKYQQIVLAKNFAKVYGEATCYSISFPDSK